MILKHYGVYTVDIPLPFRLNQVNCFIGEGVDGWVIVDTGLNKKDTYNVWTRTLKKLKINFQDINQILLTHRHPDHCGFTNTLHQLTRADVYMSKIDWDIYQNAWDNQATHKSKTFYKSLGIDKNTILSMEENRQKTRHWIEPLPKVSFIEEGDLFKIGNFTYKALHTPGHSEGHFSFYNEDEKVMFIGDHVLKRITPNISVFHNTSSNPLKLYLDSLDQLKKLEVSITIPSHGQPFDNFQERIEEIKLHHQLRLEGILKSLTQYHDVISITQYIFKNKLDKRDLHFGIGEIIAHLNYLEEKNEIRRIGTQYYLSD